jgi:hypothetical protein
MIDVKSGVVTPNAMIVVEGNHIRSAGPASPPPATRKSSTWATRPSCRG